MFLIRLINDLFFLLLFQFFSFSVIFFSSYTNAADCNNTQYTPDHFSLSIVSRNFSAVSIKWVSLECVTEYNIIYCDNSSNKYSPCISNKNYTCASIKLSGDQKCKIKVSGRYGNGEKVDSHYVNVDRIPHPPSSFKIYWDSEYNLKLKWNAPKIGKEDVKKFKGILTYSGNREIITFETKELTYTIKNYHPGKKIMVQISACNQNYCSKKESKHDSTPPERPKPLNFNCSVALNDSNAVNISIFSIEDTNDRVSIGFTSTNETIEINGFSKWETKRGINLSTYNIVCEVNVTKLPHNCVFVNESLKPNRYYYINFLVVNTFIDKNVAIVKKYGIRTLDITNQQQAWYRFNTNYFYILTIIPIIMIIIIYFIYRKSYKKYHRKPFVNESINLNTITNNKEAEENPYEIVKENQSSNINIGRSIIEKMHPRLSMCEKSKKIKLNELGVYINNCIDKDIRRQFEVFAYEYVKPSLVNSNQVSTIHISKVKMKTINKSEDMNAFYVDGYKTPEAYIVTKIPKISQKNCFWKMIWQENVQYIVMITNVDEKMDLDQYWPNLGQSVNFGDIKLTGVNFEILSCYERKTFNLMFKDMERTVTHMCFTRWPDNGTPFYPESFVPFAKYLLSINCAEASPIVVQSKTGRGRTGTFMLLDICLRMAVEEETIDFFKTLNTLRKQHPCLVENLQQYMFTHFIIFECLFGLSSTIPCNENLEQIVKDVLENELLVQMRYLEETNNSYKSLNCLNSRETKSINDSSKNRFQMIVPEENSQVYLSPFIENDESSMYINAVTVDGFYTRNEFIVTAQPMPNTLGDFWRLVFEYKCSTIISLNQVNVSDKTCCQFWPENGSSIQPIMNYIIIKHVKTEYHPYFDIITVVLKTQTVKQKVDIIQVKQWSSKCIVPKGIQDFVSFVSKSESFLSKSEATVITCYDGATASGLYLAMKFLIEKIKFEQEIDVCQAVRNIRQSRRQFITQQEQFVFLYKAAVLYVKGFQLYDNFSLHKRKDSISNRERRMKSMIA